MKNGDDPYDCLANQTNTKFLLIDGPLVPFLLLVLACGQSNKHSWHSFMLLYFLVFFSFIYLYFNCLSDINCLYIWHFFFFTRNYHWCTRRNISLLFFFSKSSVCRFWFFIIFVCLLNEFYQICKLTQTFFYARHNNVAWFRINLVYF